MHLDSALLHQSPESIDADVHNMLALKQAFAGSALTGTLRQCMASDVAVLSRFASSDATKGFGSPTWGAVRFLLRYNALRHLQQHVQQQ